MAWLLSLISSLFSAGLSALLPFLQTQKDAPIVVHDALPDPKQDEAVADAIEDDIASGRAPAD